MKYKKETIAKAYANFSLSRHLPSCQLQCPEWHLASPAIARGKSVLTAKGFNTTRMMKTKAAIMVPHQRNACAKKSTEIACYCKEGHC